jgi:serine phosphatase RsbU (regulator of sigma subunit)
VVTALARYAVGTLSAQGWSPRRVLERLNQTLRDPDDPERYATAVYGVLSARAARYPEAGASSPEAGVPSPEAAGEGGFTLDLALGGHPAPLLRRRDGTVAEVGRHGTALGLLPEVEIHEERVHLERGDVLVAYTDGVTEARHGAEFFGERRLIQAVLGAGSTADDVADAVLSAVRAFAPDQDDVALLVLAVPLTGH